MFFEKTTQKNCEIVAPEFAIETFEEQVENLNESGSSFILLSDVHKGPHKTLLIFFLAYNIVFK